MAPKEFMAWAMDQTGVKQRQVYNLLSLRAGHERG